MEEYTNVELSALFQTNVANPQIHFSRIGGTADERGKALGELFYSNIFSNS